MRGFSIVGIIVATSSIGVRAAHAQTCTTLPGSGLTAPMPTDAAWVLSSNDTYATGTVITRSDYDLRIGVTVYPAGRTCSGATFPDTDPSEQPVVFSSAYTAFWSDEMDDGFIGCVGENGFLAVSIDLPSGWQSDTTLVAQVAELTQDLAAGWTGYCATGGATASAATASGVPQAMYLETRVAAAFTLVPDGTSIGNVGEIGGVRGDLHFGAGPKPSKMVGVDAEGEAGLGLEGGVFWGGRIHLGFLSGGGPIVVGLLLGFGGDGASGGHVPASLLFDWKALFAVHLGGRNDLQLLFSQSVPFSRLDNTKPASGLEYTGTAWYSRHHLAFGAQYRHAMSTDLLSVFVGVGFQQRTRR